MTNTGFSLGGAGLTHLSYTVNHLMPVREADAYRAGILADAVTLLKDESPVRQPWDPYLGYSG